MSDTRPADYREAFCARVKALRQARGFTQAEMAHALGITEEAYRKNEKRSPLPHHLIERFVAIVGTDVQFLMTGRRKKPDK